MTTLLVGDGDPLRRAAVADALTPLGATCSQVASGWDLIGELKRIDDCDVVVVAHVGSLYPDPRDIVVLSRLAGSIAPFVLYGDDTAESHVLTTHYAPVAVTADIGGILPMAARLADGAPLEHRRRI